MAILFLIAGVLFFVAAVRGGDAPKELVGILRDDFTGPNNFFAWALAIGVVAGLRYVPGLARLSTALFVLVILALVLAHSDRTGKNFITEFFKQIRATERNTQ